MCPCAQRPFAAVFLASFSSVRQLRWPHPPFRFSQRCRATATQTSSLSTYMDMGCLISTTAHGDVGPMPPQTCHVSSSSWCPCLAHTDWGFQTDVMRVIRSCCSGSPSRTTRSDTLAPPRLPPRTLQAAPCNTARPRVLVVLGTDTECYGRGDRVLGAGYGWW